MPTKPVNTSATSSLAELVKILIQMRNEMPDLADKLFQAGEFDLAMRFVSIL
ncbi:hypothetical protein [Marinomonas gallaica]|uniref:hypothetical protein n=1 Tax=Marinomonas gallaica TaxID=1806667 RepID=UPI0012E8AB48|nr:hypothetical protein [Marinomonas gallaica]